MDHAGVVAAAVGVGGGLGRQHEGLSFGEEAAEQRRTKQDAANDLADDRRLIQPREHRANEARR